MSDTTPIQIDYTSRDYESLRQDLIARVQQRLPNWTATDGADFGVALVESFAYLGDLVSYYIDRAANESTLATATKRENVVALAADLGYSPMGYQSSTVVIEISNQSDQSIVIPKGTVVSADVTSGDAVVTIPFETQYAVTVLAEANVDVIASQGTTVRGNTGYGEYLGESDGTPDQSFALPSGQVVKDSIQVYVYDGVNYIPWNRADFLSDFGPLDRVYLVDDPGTGEINIIFGDGVSGLVPAFAHLIYAVYQTSEGARGNVPAGAVTRIDSIPNLTSDEVAVISGSVLVTNNSAAFGGSDPESTESIRTLAPLAYRTANRAVTLEDYQNIALSVPGVGQASAYVDDPSAVVVTVAPYRTPGTAEVRPGYDLVSGTWTQTQELTDLKESVLTRLGETSLAGVTFSTIGPTYVTVFIAVTVDIMDGVRQSDASVLIEQAILSRFDYSQVAFGAKIYPLDISAIVTSLGNFANSVQVTRLNIVSNTNNTVGTIQAAEDELLVVSAASLTVTVTGGVEDSL